MWLLAWEFLLIKSVLHFAFLHLLSGSYYYEWLCSNRCAEALVAYRNSLLNRLNIDHGGKILTIIIITTSYVSLSYFILFVSMRYKGKLSCMSYIFPVAILNGIYFFSLWKQWKIASWALLNKFYLTKTQLCRMWSASCEQAPNCRGWRSPAQRKLAVDGCHLTQTLTDSSYMRRFHHQ